MRSLICGLLSLTLLINSATPAFAQLVSAGRAVSRASTQTGRVASQVSAQTAAHVPTLLRGTGLTSTKQTAAIAARAQAIQNQTIRQVAHVQRNLSKTVQYQNWISKSALPSLAAQGSYQTVAERILSLPAAEQAPLLRNEFVLLSLTEQVSAGQLNTARNFLRGDLNNKLSTFKQVSGKEFGDVLLDKTMAQSLSGCRDALSDAAALALMGTSEDAAALVALHQAAANGPFEEVATRLTGRGLLRLKAYEAFNAWAEPLKQEGEFWLGLTAYARRNHLPVSMHPSFQAKPTIQAAGLTEWLEKGNVANGLNGSNTLAATEKWMELGAKDVTPTVETTPQTGVVTGAVETVEPAAVTPVRPNLSTLGNLAVANGLKIAPSALPKIEAPVVKTSSAATTTPAQAAAAPAKTSSNSGILYSGLPVFALFKSAEKTWNWLSGLWKKEKPAPRPVVPEEPGLHDNTVRSIYEKTQAPASLEAEDMQALAAAPHDLEVAESGFKLTAEDENAVESILHNVDVTIDTGFKVEGYNRVALSKDYIFELRNLTQPAKQMEHFFFKLSDANGELYHLAVAAGISDKMHRALRVKLQRRPNVRYPAVTLQTFDFATGNKMNMLMEVDASLLPSGAKNGKILLANDGKIYYESAAGSRTLLDGYYVRLPKEDSKYWVPLMQGTPGTSFSLEVHSTRNKTALLTQAIPFSQIGLGKTMAPELKDRSSLEESTSTVVMMSINNVLPVMMGLVNPLLKRYGEAKVLRWGQGMFVAGGATALASGLYGTLGTGLMSSLQLTGFIGSSIMIALGSNITRFVQNNLISANRGKIVPKNSFAEPAKTAAVHTGPAPTYDLKYLGSRAKEVFTKAPAAARDVVLFQTATMFKNLGTMAFLTFPWLANVTARHLFGVELGLDFSASYVPYSIFGFWTAMKLRRTAYKDAFPMNLTTVNNNFNETLSTTTSLLAQQPISALVEGEEVMRAAKSIKASMDDLTRVEIRQLKTSLSKQTLLHESESVEAFRQQLLANGKSAEEAQTGSATLQKAFDSLDHRDVSLWQVLLKPKMTPAVAAMALATMHELSVSNGFAFAMHGLLGNGAQANAYTALALYGSMSAGRILGNIISRRISGGSMYALSSTFSLAGTALMAASAGNSVPSLITGAIIASFGVGNFFSQMYEYMIGLYPKHRREIALLINYTMPAAAVMSFPMRWLVGVTGFSGMDLVAAEAAVLSSILLTPGMLANSSLVKVGKNLWTQAADKIKNIWRKTPPSAGAGLTEAVAQ